MCDYSDSEKGGRGRQSSRPKVWRNKSGRKGHQDFDTDSADCSTSKKDYDYDFGKHSDDEQQETDENWQKHLNKIHDSFNQNESYKKESYDTPGRHFNLTGSTNFDEFGYKDEKDAYRQNSDTDFLSNASEEVFGKKDDTYQQDSEKDNSHSDMNKICSELLQTQIETIKAKLDSTKKRSSLFDDTDYPVEDDKENYKEFAKERPVEDGEENYTESTKKCPVRDYKPNKKRGSTSCASRSNTEESKPRVKDSPEKTSYDFVHKSKCKKTSHCKDDAKFKRPKPRKPNPNFITDCIQILEKIRDLGGRTCSKTKEDDGDLTCPKSVTKCEIQKKPCKDKKEVDECRLEKPKSNSSADCKKRSSDSKRKRKKSSCSSTIRSSCKRENSKRKKKKKESCPEDVEPKCKRPSTSGRNRTRKTCSRSDRTSCSSSIMDDCGKKVAKVCQVLSKTITQKELELQRACQKGRREKKSQRKSKARRNCRCASSGLKERYSKILDDYHKLKRRYDKLKSANSCTEKKLCHSMRKLENCNR